MLLWNTSRGIRRMNQRCHKPDKPIKTSPGRNNNNYVDLLCIFLGCHFVSHHESLVIKVLIFPHMKVCVIQTGKIPWSCRVAEINYNWIHWYPTITMHSKSRTVYTFLKQHERSKLDFNTDKSMLKPIDRFYPIMHNTEDLCCLARWSSRFGCNVNLMIFKLISSTDEYIEHFPWKCFQVN